jgi:hypothetical protein
MDALSIKNVTEKFLSKKGNPPHYNELINLLAEYDDSNSSFVFLACLQSALESGFGKSSLAVKENNFFGLKYANMFSEFVSGKVYYRDDNKGKSVFCSFASVKDCLDAYEKLMSSGRYEKVFGASSLGLSIAYLENAGYATTGYYGYKLINTFCNITEIDDDSREELINNYWKGVVPYVKRIALADPTGKVVRKVSLKSSEIPEEMWNDVSLNDYRLMENSLLFNTKSSEVLAYERGGSVEPWEVNSSRIDKSQSSGIVVSKDGVQVLPRTSDTTEFNIDLWRSSFIN